MVFFVAVSVAVTMTTKMELQAGVCVCGCDSDYEDGVVGWCPCGCVCDCDSDDEDGVVGWCSCVCGCDSDDEWMIQHLEIFLVILPGENKLLKSYVLFPSQTMPQRQRKQPN